MMKITKPVLTNDFLLSPVQFTSLNTIVFKNVKSVYDVNEKIFLEYEHSSKIEASSRDWIGIFPRGWTTLQQYVTFEWSSQSLPSTHNEQNKENGDLTRRVIHFCSKYHIGTVNSASYYQFVYISKQIEVLGVSTFFRFDTNGTGDIPLELECLVPVSSKIRSTSFSDIGILMANKISSTTSLDTRTLQTTSIHSLQNLDADGKPWIKSHIPVTMSDLKKPSSFIKKTTGTGDNLDPYSSHSEPVFPMSVPITHCKKCFHIKRGGEFLRSQQVLQSKVGPRLEEASLFTGQRRTYGYELFEHKLKIVMERNKVLEERVLEMKKEMERLQTESKKMKTSFYNTNKEKVAYEKFVKDFIKSLEKDSVVRVVNGNTEFLVKKVNYVGMEEHPRDKKTSKRERELKAVIGLQEITIRNLINSLQEKAKSVQELNQTVELAQAFSAAREEDSKDFESDVEEAFDEVSNSDVTSEYEFSLTKPQPPEEVAVEETDAVLDDIRRTTEMELKDIGISRSLGKSSSRESGSELELPNLSVRSFQGPNECIRPKKPRLFDNVEDCWPLPQNTPKVVRSKVLETELNVEDSKKEETLESGEQLEIENSVEPLEPEAMNCDARSISQETEVDKIENYFDACEGLNSDLAPAEQSLAMIEDKTEEKQNFLLTAIIPRDLDVKPQKNVDEWLSNENTALMEKSMEVPEKGKKFTCQLSIDFAAKVVPTCPEGGDVALTAIDNIAATETQNNSLELVPCNQVQLDDVQTEKVLSLKKCNQCLEIKISQVDQTETKAKNVLEQKMVVKFEKDTQHNSETSKNSKIEFNLAVTGVKESTQLENSEPKPILEDSKISKPNVSPRTVWNGAEETTEEDKSMPKVVPPPDEPGTPDAPPECEKSTPEEPIKEESNVYEDSLRYEKNLEFLQQKTGEEEPKDDASTDKPTAILIQNGQTKLALIRYQ